jgi:hypothetical protein
MDRRVLWPAVFTIAYIVGAFAFAAVNRNLEFVYYGGMMVAFVVAVGVMDRRVKFTKLVLWLLAIWGALHMAGGNLPIPPSVSDPPDPAVLYNLRPFAWCPKFDQVTHAFGFFVGTLAGYEALRAGLAGQTGHPGRPVRTAMLVTPGIAAGLACLGMGLGAFNEVVEFVATRIMTKTNVGGYDNTGWDLVSNMTGACTAAAWLWWRDRGLVASGRAASPPPTRAA